MSVTMYNDFGCAFNDLIKGSVTLARLIPGIRGQRTSVQTISAAPFPLDGIPAGTLVIYYYYALTTKLTYDQISQTTAIPFSVNGVLPPTRDQLAATFTQAWARYGVFGVDDFEWDINENGLYLDGEGTIAVCCCVGFQVVPSTTVQSVEINGHTESLSVYGSRRPIPDGVQGGRSMPRYDFATPDVGGIPR